MKLDSGYNLHIGSKQPRYKNGANSRLGLTSNFSFKGDPLKIVENGLDKYTNADKIIESIDEILGKDKFLKSCVKKAGFAEGTTQLVFKHENFLDAFISTVAYPFTQMPFELINWVCKGLQKTPLRTLGEKILKNGFIESRLKSIDARKNYELAHKILDQFCDNEKLFQNDADKLANRFSQLTSEKILKTAKAYASRDERSLNRIVTGGIGAILSAKDMYNISMLEKNDKNSAKQAEKSRKDQELTRVGLSAGLTFLTLGIFDKFTKGDHVLSSIIIAGSTLFAEIFSRILKHKSLLPISPERAAKIAKKQNNKTEQKLTETQILLNRINENDKAKLFKNFTSQNAYGLEQSGKLIEPEVKITEGEKKNRHIGLKILGTFVLCSAIYLAIRHSKGEKAQKILREEIFNREKDLINQFIEDGDITKLPQKLIDEINEATKVKDSIFDVIKDKMTKRDAQIDISQLEQQIEKLKNSDELKGAESIIELYQKQIDMLKSKGTTIYSQKVKNTVTNALYEGFTKLFNILYTILSYPMKLVCKISDNKFKVSESKFKDVNILFDNKNEDRLVKQYKKQLAELYKMFDKYKDTADGDKKIAQLLNTHARNFEGSAETSDLASFSRTLVTLIASYFYVNDFRNSVLIESEGKNIERANEVMNDSIGFKLCNLFFNGTLMNLFNSTFKGILNGSLIGAAAVAAATELTNEFMIRQTISRPMKKMNSRDEIIEFERSKANRRGFAGWWTRAFKKLTGQKSLVEKYEASQAKKK